MKRKIHLLSLLSLLLLFSCSERNVELTTLPKIAITKADPAVEGEYSVRITPDEITARWRYVLTDEGSLSELFVEGSGFTEVEGNAETDVSFQMASVTDSSVIAAVAFNADGENGPIAVYKMEDVSDEELYLTSEMVYTTHCSAGIKISWTSGLSQVDWYFGTKEDEEAFMNGSLVDSCLFDFSLTEFYVNEFDLQPDTEYILYIRGIDRYGEEIQTVMYPVHTLPAGECPSVEMVVDYVDVYKADLTFNAAGSVDSMWTMPLWEAPQSGIDTRNGDIIGAMEAYIATFLWGKLSTDEGSLKTTELNGMYIDSTKYFYAVAFSGDEKYLYRLGYSTPSYNEDVLTECDVDIEVTNITTYGADYKFTFGEDVFAFLYGTVDADWYDSIVGTPEWSEFYINEYLAVNGAGLVYKDDITDRTYTCKDYRQQAGKRLYVVVAPINENGFGAGWMPAVFQEYTTLSRN